MGWQAEPKDVKNITKKEAYKMKDELQKFGEEAPYGYDFKRDAEGNVVGLQQNEVEAWFASRIYKSCLEKGGGNSNLAKRLNTCGIKGKHEEDWTEESVTQLLTNPLYAGYWLEDGKWTGHDEQDKDLVIVSYESWERAQTKQDLHRGSLFRACKNNEIALQSHHFREREFGFDGKEDGRHE